MAIGLTRRKNLSERNLNLKTALQKLYAPGIEDDIELFSLSSAVESLVTSGQFSDEKAQITGFRDESLRTLSGEVQKRTKFITKFFTLTDLNEVYFSRFDVSVSSGADIVSPKSTENGELYLATVLYGGRGFYFLNSADQPVSPAGDFVVENVVLRGQISGRITARAKITFSPHPTTGVPNGELTKFTLGNTSRYSIKSVEITQNGSGYIFPERLDVVEGNAILASNGSLIKLRKQKGQYFDGQIEIIRTELYTYEVRGADRSGFFLFDIREGKYIFLSQTTAPEGFSAQLKDKIQIRRFDGINIDNLLQFKFVQSVIRLRDYGGSAFRIGGGSISGVISGVAASTNNLQIRTQTAIQNTSRPIEANSPENILGYEYNSFKGQDVTIWQRVVIRDPDFVLNPLNDEYAPNSITGDRLRGNVVNFEMDSLDSPVKKIRVPGLFIKVGTDYFRAFSTTDKPFFAQNSSGVVLNPQIAAGANRYSLGAESLVPGSNTTLYSYRTTISELAQRLHPNGVDGAFYYHRATAPTRRSVTTRIGSNSNAVVYAYPLFTLTSA